MNDQIREAAIEFVRAEIAEFDQARACDAINTTLEWTEARDEWMRLRSARYLAMHNLRNLVLSEWKAK